VNGDELRALQAPLKTKYKEHPEAALLTLHATGTVHPSDITFSVQTRAGVAVAGLHPATGGDGASLCSGDMLLEALVACAGVTLKAVSTAMGIPLQSGTVRAEGDLDFRGTLGVARDAPVGFKAIRLFFELQSEAEKEKLEKLVSTTERYCVVYQTLKASPSIAVSLHHKAN
jgi:uncharacterized OsmC-like protein